MSGDLVSVVAEESVGILSLNDYPAILIHKPLGPKCERLAYRFKFFKSFYEGPVFV